MESLQQNTFYAVNEAGGFGRNDRPQVLDPAVRRPMPCAPGIPWRSRSKKLCTSRLHEPSSVCGSELSTDVTIQHGDNGAGETPPAGAIKFPKCREASE